MATYLLIPGAGGAAWYWHLVVEELRRRGHDPIAADLPGDDDDAGLDAYADAAVEAAGGRGPVTVVAQSLGGFTAPRLVERLEVEEVAFLNAMIPAPGETAGAWWDATGQEEAQRAGDIRDGRDPDAPFDPAVAFLHDVPVAMLDAAWEHARDQSGRPFGDVGMTGPWPAGLRLRALAGRDDRFFPAEFQVRVAQERIGAPPDVIPGGHLLALSQPVALTDWLLGA